MFVVLWIISPIAREAGGSVDYVMTEPNIPYEDSRPDRKKSRRERVAELTARWTPERITALLDAMGATQEEIADRLLCKQATVSDWCTGRVKPRNMALAWLDQLEAEILERGYVWNERYRRYYSESR